MLRSVKTLEGLAIGATDGPIGKVKDFYFDDEAWVIRYAVVDTKHWLGGREVLISPYLMGQPDWAAQTLTVNETKQRIESSPSIDTDKPVSRQYETGYLGYYGYPDYWGGMGLWGAGYFPGTLHNGAGGNRYRGYEGYLRAPTNRADHNSDPHLRSCNTVKGYHIRARDGEIGHVQGFLVDDQTWSIRYLILNTSNWWIGHHVLVSPEWIQNVDWFESVLTIDLDRKAIQDSPAYEAEAPFDREAEGTLYNHYGRDSYWLDSHSAALA